MKVAMEANRTSWWMKEISNIRREICDRLKKHKKQQLMEQKSNKELSNLQWKEMK